MAADKPVQADSSLGLTLILIRHGLTAWNAEGRLQGQTDIPLSEEGRQQAGALGRRLERDWARGILPGPPDRAYTSDLSRARETAEIALEAHRERIPLRQMTELRERGFGKFEGLTEAESRARFGDASHQQDGEPYRAVYDRMLIALAHIWEECARPTSSPDGKGVALVTGHGGSLRLLLCRAVGLGADAVRHFHLQNTGLSVIEFQGASLSESRGRLHLVNDSSHLHDSALSYSST